MTRAEIHQRFVARFGGSRASAPFTQADLGCVEAHFRIRLPASYCEFVTTHGAVRCNAQLLDLIVDQDSNLWDIAEFLPAAQVISNTTLYVRGGMSDKLVGFASDSMGNLFGFERSTLAEKREDGPVWFFDHEFCKEELLEKSFDSWLSKYLTLKGETVHEA